MAAATNTLTRAVDFTVEDWYALPKENPDERLDPGYWYRSTDLVAASIDGLVIIGLVASMSNPVPVIDVAIGEFGAAEALDLAAALIHISGVVDEIARREAL